VSTRPTAEQPPAGSADSRRVSVESAETSTSAEGKVAGVVDEPFAAVREKLSDPGQWCDILMLHMNNKSCRMTPTGKTPTITLKIAKRYDQSAEEAAPVTFAYHVVESTPDHLVIRLDAPEGPFWTRDHKIMVEASPVDGQRTLLRLAYSYGFGMPTRMMTDIYFATVGQGKVGFTKHRSPSGGAPHFIGGIRGLMERNTMRYFLAADAYLGEHGPAGPKLTERRLRRWFEATERRPRQLREMDLDTYLALKRREFDAGPPATR
jgi:hypothetical protein